MTQDSLMDRLTAGRRDGGGRPYLARRIALVCIVLGLLLVGAVVYEAFISNPVAQRAWANEAEDLRAQWEEQGVPAEGLPTVTSANEVRGDAVGLLRIPKFGEDYEVPVLAGTDRSSLKRGVGWYESAVAPGQIGNFSLAGHRVTNGQPFRKILELEVGDDVVVETREAIYTYRMISRPADLTVEDDAAWVLEPVPGQPDTAPRQEILTLTTAQDILWSSDRSVGFGRLAGTRFK